MKFHYLILVYIRCFNFGVIKEIEVCHDKVFQRPQEIKYLAFGSVRFHNFSIESFVLKKYQKESDI